MNPRNFYLDAPENRLVVFYFRDEKVQSPKPNVKIRFPTLDFGLSLQFRPFVGKLQY